MMSFDSTVNTVIAAVTVTAIASTSACILLVVGVRMICKEIKALRKS